jgi:hypothetical protein
MGRPGRRSRLFANDRRASSGVVRAESRASARGRVTCQGDGGIVARASVAVATASVALLLGKSVDGDRGPILRRGVPDLVRPIPHPGVPHRPRKHRARQHHRRGASIPPAWWLSQALCIHHYEGAWNANTGNGYYGGMQFLLSTWASVGGMGRPDLQSPKEQLYRAWLVYRRDGNSWREWSTARLCGLT